MRSQWQSLICRQGTLLQFGAARTFRIGYADLANVERELAVEDLDSLKPQARQLVVEDLDSLKPTWGQLQGVSVEDLDSLKPMPPMPRGSNRKCQ